eukprot:CAMPEP_0197506972 /NCGR_PEP_ID=MMETSP1312-20131121/11534_1 /TAXON_ID=464262 /ORGANISM="Genus nov. species nov., Strain RCC2335" /LENGTH=57 /DNA_ID=CAMNT_0043054417 /DNA_START=68 /DNA_END=238 /DNA_ORIENTATION=+
MKARESIRAHVCAPQSNRARVEGFASPRPPRPLTSSDLPFTSSADSGAWRRVRHHDG